MLDSFLNSFTDYAVYFFGVLGDPTRRLFGLFLFTSIIFAYLVYRRNKSSGSFLSFLFPKFVWSHPTAWLDVRYFFFHGLIGHFLLFSLNVTLFVVGLNIGSAFNAAALTEATSQLSPIATFIIAAIAFIIITLINDFMSFYLHYLQHKIPLLWQFHKVHHSGEVMHPLSNFREHPIDNLTYKTIIALVTGLSWGFIIMLLGYEPDQPTILGIALVGTLFNLAGYHLRHSHIWLKWPGIWSKVFASPAHHQIHHSRHPDHLDKNFAFTFPFWDVLFGTYEMPEDNKDVEFGIVEDSSELNSCLNLYFIPFRDAYRLMRYGTAHPVQEDLSQSSIRSTNLVPETEV
jgi:sterol desaturase/sphingolipid hydroxylase (fatty acid hydroxylase superfamily)